MRKYLSLFLLIAVLIPLTAEAITVKIENPLVAKSFTELIENIIRFLFWISLFVGALMIVVAAFFFLTSGGDPEKVKTAKNTIIWTLVGILVLFLSLAFVELLKEILGVKPTP